MDATLGDAVECCQPTEGQPPFFVTAKPGRFASAAEVTAWVKDHRAALDALIAQRGAVVLRGFPIATSEDFAGIVACFPAYTGGYQGGAAARRAVAQGVYEATQRTGDQRIPIHQEMFYIHDYPPRIAFFAKKVAEEGGETTIADMRAITRALPAGIRDKLERLGIQNVRNFAAKTGSTEENRHMDKRGWDFAFYTDSEAEVEAVCRRRQMRPHWHDDGSLTVFPTAGGAPRFTSTHPLDDLPTALAFATFTQQARQAVIDGLAWEVTVDEWIASLPLDAAFKADVLYPWITATIGCSRADAARVSARSILQTFALAFPENPAAGASTFSSRIGLQGNLQRLLEASRVRRVRRNSIVTALDHGRDGWSVTTPNGTRGGYRYLVMNAPPHVSRALLKRLPHFAKVAEPLSEYRYFSSRLLVHRDPVYVPADPSYWTAYNAGLTGSECEGSAWMGALTDPLASGAPIDLFKSWAQRRSADPRRIIFQREFQHPLITSRTIAAARRLQRFQGRRGLYFSGSYTTGSDLQETALYSAMKVAEEIAPRSRTLRSLQERMRANGIADVSYDL